MTGSRNTLGLRPLACLCLFLISISGTIASSQAGDWPQWRGPERDGISKETGLLTDWKQQKPELVWIAEGLGEGFASVSVAEGRIYTTGNVGDSQSVVAVQASDGTVLWKTELTSKRPQHSYEGSRSTPTVDGNRLYVVSSDGQIACLETEDGRLVWQRDFRKDWNGKMMSGWGYSESPLVDGDLVLCTPGGPDAMIVALDKMTGREVWKSAVPEFGDARKRGAGYSSIVTSRGAGVKQYVQVVGAGVVGVRASDGKFLWGYSGVANGTANIPTPLIAGDYVFVSTGYGAGAALLQLKRDGRGVEADEVYFLNSKTLQNHHGGMILVGDHVYCGHGHNNGFPICVNLKSGKVVWGGDVRGEGRGSAAVAYADGHLIFRYQSGEVALVEATPEGYELKGSFMPAYQQGNSWAHPVVAGGRLYLREQNKLMCYNLKQAS